MRGLKTIEKLTVVAKNANSQAKTTFKRVKNTDEGTGIMYSTSLLACLISLRSYPFLDM